MHRTLDCRGLCLRRPFLTQRLLILLVLLLSYCGASPDEEAEEQLEEEDTESNEQQALQEPQEPKLEAAEDEDDTQETVQDTEEEVRKRDLDAEILKHHKPPKAADNSADEKGRAVQAVEEEEEVGRVCDCSGQLSTCARTCDWADLDLDDIFSRFGIDTCVRSGNCEGCSKSDTAGDCNKGISRQRVLCAACSLQGSPVAVCEHTSKNLLWRLKDLKSLRGAAASSSAGLDAMAGKRNATIFYTSCDITPRGAGDAGEDVNRTIGTAEGRPPTSHQQDESVEVSAFLLFNLAVFFMASTSLRKQRKSQHDTDLDGLIQVSSGGARGKTASSSLYARVDSDCGSPARSNNLSPRSPRLRTFSPEPCVPGRMRSSTIEPDAIVSSIETMAAAVAKEARRAGTAVELAVMGDSGGKAAKKR